MGTKLGNQQNANAQSEEISLKELIEKLQGLWRYLLSKWIVILVFCLVGGILGYFYASNKKPIYIASTVFVLEDDAGSRSGGLAGLASMAGLDLGGGGGGVFQGDNIIGLYKSRTMLEQTLLSPIFINGRKELLVERYISFNGLKEKWDKIPGIKSLTFITDTVNGKEVTLKPNRTRDSIMNVIITDVNSNSLSVDKPDKKLSIIKVDVKSIDEIFAKEFNDALVKNVNEFYINTKTKKALKNVLILQHKTDSVRSVMNGAIYSAVAVSDATPNLNPTKQIQKLAPAQRAQFSAETNKYILSELVKNLEMGKMALLKEAPLVQIIDGPIYPLNVEKLAKSKGIFIGAFILGIFSVITIFVKKLLKTLR